MKKFLFLMLLISVSLGIYAQETITLANGEWPPYLSQDLKEDGVISHIVKEAFALEGIKVNYKFVPWKRAFESSKQGKMDGSVIWSKTDERAQFFYYSDPVLQLKTVFFHRRDMNFDWNSFADLAGKNIGITDGYDYGPKFTEAQNQELFNVEVVSKEEMNVKKLYHKRIDLMPAQLKVGLAFIGKELTPNQQKEITYHKRNVNIKNYYLIISKNAENAVYFTEKFNSGLKKLKASGKYDEYMRKSDEGWYKK